jgi:hypothetical protein
MNGDYSLFDSDEFTEHLEWLCDHGIISSSYSIISKDIEVDIEFCMN